MNISNPTHRPTVRPFALALLVSVVGTTQALASEPAGVRVNYSDLNLDTSAGAHTLYTRISGAARIVCGFEGTTLIDQSIWRHCYRGAIATAVAKVDRPLLAAAYAGHPAAQQVAMLRK